MRYIRFSATYNVSISAFHRWNGIIEYSYDNKEWEIWHGEKIINHNIYMRGVNNTKISKEDRWTINGENIKCQGNIENLLNYQFVNHPKMEKFCFGWMFADCKNLTEAPQLLSTELSSNCYHAMFSRCTSLRKVPKLVIRSTNQCYCYYRMFENCSEALVNDVCFPSLSAAKEIIINQRMFGLTSIKTININNKLYDINVLKLV